MSFLNIAGSNDLNAIRQSITDGLFNVMSEVSVNLQPKFKTIVATYGASVLLANGAATLAGRKSLIIRNTDTLVPVRIGPTSANAIYEEGIVVEPGQSMVLTFTGSDVDIYARSAGYEVTLEVAES